MLKSSWEQAGDGVLADNLMAANPCPELGEHSGIYKEKNKWFLECVKSSEQSLCVFFLRGWKPGFMHYLVTGAVLSVTLLGILDDHALISQVLPVAGQVPFFLLLYAAASHMSEGKAFSFHCHHLGMPRSAPWWEELRFALYREKEAAEGKLCLCRPALKH